MKPSYSMVSGRVHNRGGYWLGGYRSAETGQFKWIDNSPFSFFFGAQNSFDDHDFLEDAYLINELRYTGMHNWHINIFQLTVCELIC